MYCRVASVNCSGSTVEEQQQLWFWASLWFAGQHNLVIKTKICWCVSRRLNVSPLLCYTLSSVDLAIFLCPEIQYTTQSTFWLINKNVIRLCTSWHNITPLIKVPAVGWHTDLPWHRCHFSTSISFALRLLGVYFWCQLFSYSFYCCCDVFDTAFVPVVVVFSFYWNKLLSKFRR